MDVLTSKSTSDPEGYLAHPVNAYKLVKRLNTDWLELENLVLQDTTNGEELQGRCWWEVPLQQCCFPFCSGSCRLSCGLNTVANLVWNLN